MFQGLTLEQAPPYTIPIKFYLTATLYLIALSIIILIYGLHVSSRYDCEMIAITHLFTIGFITHVMFGSLFQMLPVMLGGTLLVLTFCYFCFLSLKTVFSSEEINTLVQNFAASFVALFLAVIFGFSALLGYFGFVDTIKYGNIHIAFMLFGWVFIYVCPASRESFIAQCNKNSSLMFRDTFCTL